MFVVHASACRRLFSQRKADAMDVIPSLTCPPQSRAKAGRWLWTPPCGKALPMDIHGTGASRLYSSRQPGALDEPAPKPHFPMESPQVLLATRQTPFMTLFRAISGHTHYALNKNSHKPWMHPPLSCNVQHHDLRAFPIPQPFPMKALEHAFPFSRLKTLFYRSLLNRRNITVWNAR